jgi:hypothetical protein
MDDESPRLLLSPPGNQADPHQQHKSVVRRTQSWAVHGEVAARGTAIELVREQRDGLVRRHDLLAATVRRLREENEVLAKRLSQYASYPSPEERHQEAADAQALEAEHGIQFRRMPESVYPGKPYVTQQDLLKGGTTQYSRQNISRLVRIVKALPSVVIGDRVLLSPAAVRALLSRERAAAEDVSPRRRPGRKRGETISR